MSSNPRELTPPPLPPLRPPLVAGGLTRLARSRGRVPLNIGKRLLGIAPLSAINFPRRLPYTQSIIPVNTDDDKLYGNDGWRAPTDECKRWGRGEERWKGIGFAISRNVYIRCTSLDVHTHEYLNEAIPFHLRRNLYFIRAVPLSPILIELVAFPSIPCCWFRFFHGRLNVETGRGETARCCVDPVDKHPSSIVPLIRSALENAVICFESLYHRKLEYRWIPLTRPFFPLSIRFVCFSLTYHSFLFIKFYAL